MDQTTRINQLIDSLPEADLTTQLEIERALLDMGEAALPLLSAAMLGHEGRKAYKAARILGKMALAAHNLALVDPLCAALGSPHFMVRQTAAQVLGVLGDRRAMTPLIKTLQDEKVQVQLWVVESLAKFDDPGVISPLVETLQQTPSPTLRYTIIRVLGTLGDPAVLPVILAFQDDADYHVRSKVRDAVHELNQIRQGLSKPSR
jgi:HEAT repeat protein